MRRGVIYKAQFPNGKCYIGQTRLSLAARIAQHYAAANCRLFARALAKYGEPQWIVLARLDAEGLDAAEQFYIAAHGTMSPRGYNLTEGGEGGAKTPETRARMSAAQKKRGTIPPSRKGARHSAETRTRMRTSQTKSPARRAKIADGMRRYRARQRQTQTGFLI